MPMLHVDADTCTPADNMTCADARFRDIGLFDDILSHLCYSASISSRDTAATIYRLPY